MKNTLFLGLFSATLAVAGFSSCSSDNDSPVNPTVVPPSTANVFTNGMPASVAGATFSLSSDGQLTRISQNPKTWDFAYGQFNYSGSPYQIMMTVTNQYEANDTEIYYMQINDYGFVTSAVKVPTETGEDPETLTFTYNASNQLIQVKGSDSDDNYSISYEGGNISKVTGYDDGATTAYTFTYTNQENPQETPNTGKVMMFDKFFNVDLGDLDMAYYAGLLGQPTKNLPMGYREVSSTGQSNFDYSLTYNWEFNVEGLPVKYWQGENQWYVIDFVW